MQTLPAEIYSVKSVRELDRLTISDHGVGGYTLMTRAAAAAVAAARRRFPGARHWQVVCGAGNNGGDGYVAARLAAEQGLQVTAVSLIDPGALSGDAARAHADFVASGGGVQRWTGSLDPLADLLVDALLGSGLSRDVEADFAAAVVAINGHSAPVVSLDIPSGIDGDTGAVHGAAVCADLTITFVGLKTGLFTRDGPDHCGALVFADLSVPPDCRAAVAPDYRRIDDVALARALPKRKRASHKGDFGHVLVIGGGEGMPGAVRLCGEAALRAGAGLVSIATHPAHAAIITATRPELMSHAILQAADLEPLLERADVVAFGPGLGRGHWAEAVYAAVAGSEQRAVWDADALNHLAVNPARKAARIITPHPGEAGRLLGSDARTVQADRPAALRALSDRFGGTAVLKGAGTLVSSATGPPYLCVAGNAGMASPGMGDALTGIIAAIAAQGADLEQAAAVGVEVHARAGDLAARRGQRGLVAGDLIDALGGVVNP